MNLRELTHEPDTTGQRPFTMPPKRTFVVRKWHGADAVELTVEAHLLQYSTTQPMAMFIDFEHTPNGLDTRVHRVVFNVEEVEEVMRIPFGQPPQLLVSH